MTVLDYILMPIAGIGFCVYSTVLAVMIGKAFSRKES